MGKLAKFESFFGFNISKWKHTKASESLWTIFTVPGFNTVWSPEKQMTDKSLLLSKSEIVSTTHETQRKDRCLLTALLLWHIQIYTTPPLELKGSDQSPQEGLGRFLTPSNLHFSSRKKRITNSSSLCKPTSPTLPSLDAASVVSLNDQTKI